MMAKSENEFLDLYRAGLDAVLDITKVSLQGAERLRAHQLKTINDALSEAGETGKQIGSVKSFEELLELQAKFAPTQMEKAMGYWSGLYATTARNQVEILQQMQSKASDISEAYRATLDAAPRGTEPVVAPLKSVMTAMYSAYTMTARATEEAARLAVSQIESANSGIRQAVQAGAQAGTQAAQAGNQAANQMAQAASHAAEGRRKSAS